MAKTAADAPAGCCAVVIVAALVFLGAVVIGFSTYGLPQHHSLNPDPGGFLAGFTHGVLYVVSFIASLFDGQYAIYEVPNAGAWYDFGYVLGVGMFTGGGASGTSRTG